MDKKVVSLVTLSLLVVAVGATAALSQRFRAELSGSREVPPVSTDARGDFRLKIANDNSDAWFRLRVRDAEAVTMAHLHCGAVGETGPVVAHLFGTIPGGFDVDGELAEFTLHNANIVSNTCSPAITNISQLADAIRAGRIYANVHTVAHPDGEVRGQVTAQ
jgi:hypothetical protein